MPDDRNLGNRAGMHTARLRTLRPFDGAFS
jgi:hypothetical protein